MGFVTLAIAAYSAYQQRKAGKEAEEIGQANAEREQAEAGEAARRLKIQQENILAETRARSAASGIAKGSESVKTYLTEMQKSFKAEQDWIKKSAASASSIYARQGAYQRQMANIQSWGTISSGLSTAYSQGAFSSNTASGN